MSGVDRGGGGPYVPHAKTEPPRWMMHHAFKRGLALYFGSKVVMLVVALIAGPSRSGIVELLSAICSLVAIAGVVLMICGVLNFITRKRRGDGEASADSVSPS